MQDPKETFNNIEHNTEMALLQSEKIAESVDNLEPIMEGVLVKADDILNEQKKTNELLSKEEEPKPEVQKIELLGAELITIKGKDGENGDKGEKGDKGDTGERGEKGEQGERGDIGKQGEKGEKGDNGDTGKDGIDGLDGKDGKNGKNGKDGSPDTPKQVKEKLLKVGLDYNEIDNTPDINKVINIAVAGVKQSSKTVSLVELDDIDYSNLSIVDGKYVLGGGTGGATWGSITGNIVDQADLQNALNAKQDTITTGTTAQYFRGDLSLATFPTLVSSFTNDAGYITSSALSGYVPNTRTLTINGTAYDLSTDRTWSVGTVTSVAALTLGTTGTDISSSVATGTTTPVITLNVPTASALNRGALSSTDWSTFNSKESALTFSTGLTRATNTITSNLSTGISGGQSVIGGTASGDNLTLSSTSNATKGKILFGNSVYDEVNNRLGINTTTPLHGLDVKSNTQYNRILGSSGTGLLIGSYTSSEGAIWDATVTPSVTNYMFLCSGGFSLFNATAGIQFRISNSVKMTLLSNGNFGIGLSPTAVLTLKAGTATANTAPLKLTSGTNLTTPEAGAIEYDGTSFFGTPSSATRYNFLMNNLGLAGGQTVVGGTASGNNLTFSSTSNATKGKILFGTSAYDEVNDRLGIGTNAPSAKLEVRGISDFWGLQVGNGTVGALFQVYGGKAGFVGFNGSAYNSLDIRSGISTQLFLATNGNVGIGQTSPTARLHIAAGTASAETSPLKFTSGTNLTTAEAGAMEFTTDNLYFTITTGAARKNVTLDEGLTSGRVPFATTNGRLIDDADMTFATDTLTVTKLVGATSVKVGTAAGYISSDGSTGATGTFTTADLKTVTVKDGIITSIV